MTDEDEWKKLPTDQKVQHKAWKARSEGYKECMKQFRIWDEGSPEFNKYLGLMKKFVTDSNELIRIQAVEAALLFVENANVAKKTCGEVISGIILKCFNSKPKIKEAAINVCLMYIEIDRNELTQEELIKGFTNKQPKVATACLEAVTQALSLFGSKVVQAKPLLKEIPALADHRDKLVREAAKALAVEIYRWIGPAIKTPLQNINAVMLKELEDEWGKANTSGKPVQTRFMRSQQDLKEKMEAKAAVSASGDGGSVAQAEVEEQAEVDPYDLLDPVDIISKLPKEFYTQIEAKKWQERKEMLEICQKLCETPKIEPGDFADMVKVLKKVISKDTNVMLVTIAAKCLAGLAKGIRKKFQPFANLCSDAILEKFKEKKPNVVAALQEAIDAIYLSTNLQNISETCIEYLDSKNPSIREQTGLFLSRAFAKTKASAVNKATAKPIVQALLKNVDHSAPNVRDGAYKALGMLLKLVGEKVVMPYLGDIDNLKMDKIKEYAGKSEVQGKGNAPKQAKVVKPEPAPAKAETSKPTGAKKKVVKGGQKKTAQKKEASNDSAKPQEALLGDAAVEDQIADFLPAEVVTQLSSGNWKERLEGLQGIMQKLKLSDVKRIPCQALIKTLGSGKQGWKESNFNCLNEKFGIVKNLAENAAFSKTSAELCLSGLIEKIGDVKCGKSSKEAITAISEATSFSWVSETLLEISMAHKNPKIQAESLSWLSNAIREFGLAGANIKLFISKIKIGFAATNPAVRTAASSVMGSMTLYIGAKIRMFFESEKPAVLQQIDAEIEKCKGESPPVPIRGGKRDGGAESDGDEEEESAAAEIKMEDLVTRVNIADKITDGLLSKLSNTQWKIRREGLEEVTAILSEAKFVEPTIGELATAMKARLADSNKILVASALSILSQMSAALGSHCRVHVKTVAPGLVGSLADSKPNVRQAGLNAMNQWLENTNLSLWFEDEIMSSALSVPKHTFLRIELLNWIAEKLLATPKISTTAKEGLEACVKHLYACCEDRTGDVRAKAQAALPAFIYHLNMDKMIRYCGKLSPTSMNTIQSLLEKAKESVPERKSKQTKKSKPVAAAPIEIDIDIPKKTVVEEEPEKQATTSRSKTGSKQAKPGKKAAAGKKQQEEDDTAQALIKVPNGKELRMKDEQKLKTLKWVFDTPREELVTQLKTQLTLCVSSAMAVELFHADFQHHLKALVIFTKSLDQQWDETVGTVDLIFRWTTLRFYEKNTTVHMKCLEYLKALFEKLEGIDYRLTDYEAGAFIPHLITKIGEPKENIRKDVHAIMHQLTKVYPAGKVFTHLMQGLVTKNSRQKTECLDELGLLITYHGIEVCNPTPPKALKEVATHIGDRDNSVRSAALNVVVCAYNTCGDIIYKYVGKLNEKNLSMLEERIKRSGKFTNEPPPPRPTKQETKTVKQIPAASEKVKISTSDLHSSGSLERRRIDTDGISDIEESDYRLPQLLDTNCGDLLDEPDVEVPPKFVSRIQNRRSNDSVEATLNIMVSCLASSELDVSLKATHELDEIMRDREKRELLKPRIDQILTSSCIQIRMATNRYLADITRGNVEDGNGTIPSVTQVVSLYKSIIAVNMGIFKIPELVICASQNALQDLIQALMVFILDKRVDDLPNGPRLIQFLNVLLVNVFSTANSTYVLCAMIRLLQSSLKDTPGTLRELIAKCTWRLIHMVKGFMYPLEDSLKPPLKPNVVLAEIHNFLLAYPNNKQQREEVTVALRSIKSLINSLCKVLGMRILDEVQDIEGIESSEVLQYIVKVLRVSYPTSDIENHPVKSRTARNSSSTDRKENCLPNGNVSPDRKLALIVKKVGSREHTKEGLQELYDFKQQNPDYDIESGFINVTPLFLNYIKRSLLNIEQERKKGVTSTSNILKSTNSHMTAKDHLEHIKMLRARCGLPVDGITLNKSENKVVLVNKSGTFNNNPVNDSDQDKQELHAPLTKSVDLESSNALSEATSSSSMLPPRPATTSNMENLKRRLEKIKRDSRKRN